MRTSNLGGPYQEYGTKKRRSNRAKARLYRYRRLAPARLKKSSRASFPPGAPSSCLRRPRALAMLLCPVRCFSCGEEVCSKHEKYRELLKSGMPRTDALAHVGAHRVCCRRMLLAQPVHVALTLKTRIGAPLISSEAPLRPSESSETEEGRASASARGHAPALEPVPRPPQREHLLHREGSGNGNGGGGAVAQQSGGAAKRKLDC
jgi:DNA-directed RNA polymerase subunit N (RpoN/RPB10)